MSNHENPQQDLVPTPFTEDLAASLTGLGVIWAQTSTGVIGKDGGMPWHLPEDMKHFVRLTTGHPVIMGRKTWESFPAKYRPLPGRTNIVITRQEGWAGTAGADGAIAVKSLDDALLESADVAVVTTIDATPEGDTFAPELGYDWTTGASLPSDGWLTSANGTRYRITQWRRTKG
jgi:dihydrofolate reductase